VVQLVSVYDKGMKVRALECIGIKEGIDNPPVCVQLAIGNLVPFHLPVWKFRKATTRNFGKPNANLHSGNDDPTKNQEAVLCLTALINVYVRQ
jgi:hypothetical protein